MTVRQRERMVSESLLLAAGEEDEIDVGRGFFERLEEGVGCVGRDPIGRVEDDHADGRFEGLERGDPLDPADLADADVDRARMVVVADVAKPARLDDFDVQVVLLADPPALAADGAGLGFAALADERAGDGERDIPLADPFRPRDQQRMRAAPLRKRSPQRTNRKGVFMRAPRADLEILSAIRHAWRIRRRTGWTDTPKA